LRWVDVLADALLLVDELDGGGGPAVLGADELHEAALVACGQAAVDAQLEVQPDALQAVVHHAEHLPEREHACVKRAEKHKYGRGHGTTATFLQACEMSNRVHLNRVPSPLMQAASSFFFLTWRISWSWRTSSPFLTMSLSLQCTSSYSLWSFSASARARRRSGSDSESSALVRSSATALPHLVCRSVRWNKRKGDVVKDRRRKALHEVCSCILIEQNVSHRVK